MLHKPAKTHYRQLLIVLVANFLISPLFGREIGGLLSAGLLFYTIVLVVWNLSPPKVLLFLYIAIAALALFLQIAGNLSTHQSVSPALALVSQAIFSLYLGIAAFLILKSIFTTTKITLEIVEGGISVYFLIGYIWALFYGMIATIDIEAFSQPLVADGTFIRATHFSFTTLTTLGYGDIVPVSELATVLTNLEAIIGQMYPAVFISILVGGYLSQRSIH